MQLRSAEKSCNFIRGNITIIQTKYMPAQRYLALDIFRGMTICFMIIVNSPGSYEFVYAHLQHATWHGFTPTDLVFPSFLFAVGNALSFVAQRWGSSSKGAVIGKILKRTFLIFILGYLMYWFPFVQQTEAGWQLKPFSETRVLGVLQRIALCYGIAALMVYFLQPRWVIASTLLILVGYKYVLMGYGDLSLEGNAVLKLDRWLMGEGHMYHGEGLAFDPEGWLSTLPAIGNVVIGYFTGKYIQQKGQNYEALTHLLLAGAVMLVLGYFWDSSFPINKKLWTSSFVLYTCALDILLLAGIIYVTEHLGVTRGAHFFEVFGRNPLFIYLLSEVGVILLWTFSIGTQPVYAWLFEHLFSKAGLYFGSFLFAFIWMLICWLTGWWMDRKKIYIRV